MNCIINRYRYSIVFVIKKKKLHYIMLNNSPMKKEGRKFKILVAGHFGAGKTTFVNTLTKGNFLATEKKTTSPDERNKKASTTVAMDFAIYDDDGIEYAIFGIPGQERFAFMWEILARNTAGFIFLLDSTDDSRWFEVFKQINMFRKISPNAPFIFAANKQDLPNAMDVETVRKKLKLPEKFKVVPLVATDKDSVLNALKVLVEEIKAKKKEVGEKV